MPASAQIKVLRVSARAEGYRREGLKFGTEEVDIPESILTSNQIHRFRRDPMLTCKEVLVNTEEPAVMEEEFAALREKAASAEAQLADSREKVAVAEAELGSLRQKAVIADAFLVKLPVDYSWTQCPSEYVTHLQDRVRELELEKTNTPSTATAHSAKPSARK